MSKYVLMITKRFDSSLGSRNLEDRLHKEAGVYPDISVNWGYLDWQNGNRFGFNDEEQIPAASTRKLSILMGTLAATNAGAFDLDETFVTDDRSHEIDSGLFHRLDPGIRITYKDALKSMIYLSDNTSTMAIMERFGGASFFNRYCERIGLKQTIHRDGLPGSNTSLEKANLTSAIDIIKLLSWIERGRTDIEVANMLECDPDHCSFATDLLKGNKFNDRLPGLLPRGVAVAHKTGTIPAADKSIIADVGTVYSPTNSDRPLFSLAVFTSEVPDVLEDGTPGKVASVALISRMARICYDAVAA